MSRDNYHRIILICKDLRQPAAQPSRSTDNWLLTADNCFSKSFIPARTLGAAAEDTMSLSSTPVIRAETALRSAQVTLQQNLTNIFQDGKSRSCPPFGFVQGRLLSPIDGNKGRAPMGKSDAQPQTERAGHPP